MLAFILLVSLIPLIMSNCPSFEHKTFGNVIYAFTNNPNPNYTWDDANSLCSVCLGTNLADISNEVVSRYPNSDIQTYWIGQFDSGSLVPYLTWYTGDSPAVVVLPSTLSTRRNFVCSSPQGSSESMESFLPRYAIVNFNEDLSNISGYISFQQLAFSSRLEITINLTGLLKQEQYLIDIHKYGDLRMDCSSIGPVLDVLGRNSDSESSEPFTGSLTTVLSDEFGNAFRSFNNSRLSLFGSFSILGRSIAIHLRNYTIDDCAVIGMANFNFSETIISTQDQENNTISVSNMTVNVSTSESNMTVNSTVSGILSNQSLSGILSNQSLSGVVSNQSLSGVVSNQTASSNQTVSGVESNQTLSGVQSNQTVSEVESNRNVSGYEVNATNVRNETSENAGREPMISTSGEQTSSGIKTDGGIRNNNQRTTVIKVVNEDNTDVQNVDNIAEKMNSLNQTLRAPGSNMNIHRNASYP